MPAKTTKTPADEKAVDSLNPENPAEAAAAEVLAEGKLTIPFRGADFVIDRDILSSARFLIAIASGQDHRILFEILGPENVDRFMLTLKRGETLPVVAAEFLGAVNKSAGWGNS
jgi:hypothetical protein